MSFDTYIYFLIFFFNAILVCLHSFYLCMYVCMYVCMALLGLHFCARAFSSCGERGPLFIAVHGPLTAAASRCGAQAPRRTGSVIVAHGPSCSAACGIFPDQGSNPRPLHWQADSQPLRHQGSPIYFFIHIFCITVGKGICRSMDVYFLCSSRYYLIIFQGGCTNYNNISSV